MPLLFLLGIFLYIYCEISLLVAIGSAIGVLPLILLMIFISAAGLWLIKLRGIFTLVEIRSQLAQGKEPTDSVISSLLFVIAGILLVIPGLLSDTLAIILLLPITRQVVKSYLIRYFSDKVQFSRFGHFQQYQQNTTFEAEFERKPDEDKWIR